MGTSIAPAFTYLNAQIPAVCAAVDSTCVVFDTFLGDPPPLPAPYVVLGAESPLSQVALDGARLYVELGGYGVEEDYTIPCYIVAARGDEDQATCRNLALSLFDAIVKLVADDMTLGGSLLAGRWAEIVDVQLFGTDPEQEAPAGRSAFLLFKVHCKNRYDPF